MTTTVHFWLLKLCLVVSACIAGVLLVNSALDYGFTQQRIGTSSEEPLNINMIVLRQLSLFFGFFLLIVSLGYVYVATLLDHNVMKSGDLKILDWTLVALCVLMMPLFEIIGLEPLFWVLFIVFPSVAARLFITWWIRR